MTQLRGYQLELQQGIFDAWAAGARCVVGVTATGSGKTVTMADSARKLQGRGVVQAHRAELVGQLSQALAREGVRHNITAAKSTVKAIVNNHLDELGVSFYDPRANWDVASVDTIIRRSYPGADRVSYVFVDEAHHLLSPPNKWGKAVEMFPNARVLGMTATPTRADGKGLGRHHDGLADAMVIGPGLGDLMAQGYLTGYKVYAPTASDLDMSDVHITQGGEFNQQEAARAVKRSRKIVGDVIEHYKAVIPDKLAIVFAADIEHGHTIAEAFNRAGIPAAMVTGDTPEAERNATMKRFRRRELLVLVNVDLFGEGVDVPAVEAVILARLTASFSLYSQMIGRMLRLNISPVLMAAWDTYSVPQRLQYIAESAKPWGVLIDHVGNVYREFRVGDVKYTGLPEGFRDWTLDRRGKRKSTAADDGIPLRMCGECFKPYERIWDCCPYCGAAAPEPAQRTAPEHVDGNLFELTGDVLARMRGEVARIDDRVYVPQGLAGPAAASVVRNHAERQAAQHHLREAIAWWAGHHPGEPDSVLARRFWHTFGIDTLSAMTLGATEAERLRLRIVNNGAILPALPQLPEIAR